MHFDKTCEKLVQISSNLISGYGSQNLIKPKANGESVFNDARLNDIEMQ